MYVSSYFETLTPIGVDGNRRLEKPR